MSKHAPFPIDPVMTAIALAYTNANTIADQVLPITPVAKQEFKYLQYNNEDRLTVPDTRIGRTSEANVAEFGAEEKTASTVDYALDDYVPESDVLNAPSNYNPLNIAAEGIMELIKLDREVRVRNAVFNDALYDANNKEDITAQSFSNDACDPIEIIESAKDIMIMVPNKAVMGHDVFSALRRNPNVVKAVHRNNGDKGIASKSDLEDLFELELIVGKAFHNAANKGQDAKYRRIWSDHLVLFHQGQATTQRGITFGLTARFGQPFGGKDFDSKRGLRGSHRVRAGESVKELITAAELGYFIKNAA